MKLTEEEAMLCLKGTGANGSLRGKLIGRGPLINKCVAEGKSLEETHAIVMAAYPEGMGNGKWLRKEMAKARARIGRRGVAV